MLSRTLGAGAARANHRGQTCSLVSGESSQKMQGTATSKQRRRPLRWGTRSSLSPENYRLVPTVSMTHSLNERVAPCLSQHLVNHVGLKSDLVEKASTRAFNSNVNLTGLASTPCEPWRFCCPRACERAADMPPWLRRCPAQGGTNMPLRSENSVRPCPSTRTSSTPCAKACCLLLRQSGKRY
jgi:hypothetical protein